MLDNIDSAQMVMVDPYYSDMVICWFGTAQLHLFDDSLDELDIITIGGGINSGFDARCHASDWFDRIHIDDEVEEDD